MPSIDIEEATQVPPSRFRKGPKDSKVAEIVEKARASHTGILKLTSNDPKEIELLYKSILQYRSRHRQETQKHPFGVRKDQSTIYVWDPEKAEASSL